MKKTLLLTALGICCMVAVTGKAKAAEKVSGKYHYEILNSDKKTAALTKVEQPGTQVILPSNIDGYTIVQLGTMSKNDYSFAFSSSADLDGKAELFSTEDAEKITKLTLPSKVEKIGVMSFQGCKKIKKVTLPKALTHIGSNAFNGCESLQNITIPKKVKGIGSGAFMKCAALKKVTLKMSKATIGSEAFSTDVTDGYDANGNPKIIKKSHLTKIVMPYKYKGLLKERAFCGYVGTSFTWRDFNTYNEGFLRGCKTLKNIVFPKNLKTIDIPKHCLDDSLSTLKPLVIPEGVKAVYVGQHCRNIKCITVKGKKTVLYGDSGMGAKMISVEKVNCKKGSKTWKKMKKFVCPNFAKKFKKDTENIDTDDYYTREIVHTKKVKVAKTK